MSRNFISPKTGASATRKMLCSATIIALGFLISSSGVKAQGVSSSIVPSLSSMPQSLLTVEQLPPEEIDARKEQQNDDALKNMTSQQRTIIMQRQKRELAMKQPARTQPQDRKGNRAHEIARQVQREQGAFATNQQGVNSATPGKWFEQLKEDGFFPEEHLTISVQPQEDFTFYVSSQQIEESDLLPHIRYEKFQIAYDVIGGKAQRPLRNARPSVDVFILDPTEKVLKVSMKQGQGEFTFLIDQPGEYSIIISNIKDQTSSKTVSLAFSQKSVDRTAEHERNQQLIYEEHSLKGNASGDEEDDSYNENGLIELKDLRPSMATMNVAEQVLMQTVYVLKESLIKQTEECRLAADSQEQFFVFAIIEMLFACLFVGINLWYLRGLLKSDKRLLAC